MAPPVGIKYVQGSCACGHVGKQQYADVCGTCLRSINRSRPKETRNRVPEREREWMKNIKSKFCKLPAYMRAELVKELHELV